MNESGLVKKILAYLRAQGFWARKNHGGRFTDAGLPDILAVKDGRAYFFEVKTEAGRATEIQIHTIEKLRAAGAVAEIVRSVEDVQCALTGSPL